MKAKLGIRGHIRVWITRENGFKELVFEDHNAIQGAYADKIVDALQAATNYAIDDSFPDNANPPDNGKDGIAIKDNGGLWYGMTMAANAQSGGNVTFTGKFTGVGITVATANDVLFGHDWLTTTFVDLFAKPSSWASQAVLNTETMTIEWIINHY